MPIDSGNLALKGLDDLFSTEENRQEEQREQVQQMSGTVSYKYMMLILRTYNGSSRSRSLPIKQ